MHRMSAVKVVRFLTVKSHCDAIRVRIFRAGLPTNRKIMYTFYIRQFPGRLQKLLFCRNISSLLQTKRNSMFNHCITLSI